MAGGEGAGKSRLAAQELLAQLKPKGRYWLAGQQYEATHVEFGFLRDLLVAVGAITDIDAQVRAPTKEAWTMRLGAPFEGAMISTRTIEDWTKIRAWTLDGVIMCEAALCSYEAYKRLETRSVRRREGAWLLLTGTFEKTEGPWYAKLYNQWKVDGAPGRSFSVPTWANRVLYPSGEQDEKIELLRSEMDADRFEERHAGVPVPPSTLVFRRFDPDVHVGSYSFKKFFPLGDDGQRHRMPVELAIDPGWANYAIMAVQREKGGDGVVRTFVIDEVWGERKTTEELIQECKQRPWWGNIVPSRAGAMDVAGKQHHGDRSVREIWRAEGLVFRTRRVRIEEGIDRVASFLEDMGLRYGESPFTEPRDWSRLFIDKRCKRLIEEFTEYKYDDKPVSGRRIPIDAYNHGIKALGYWLIDRFGYSRRRRRKKIDFRMVG